MIWSIFDIWNSLVNILDNCYKHRHFCGKIWNWLAPIFYFYASNFNRTFFLKFLPAIKKWQCISSAFYTYRNILADTRYKNRGYMESYKSLFSHVYQSASDGVKTGNLKSLLETRIRYPYRFLKCIHDDLTLSFLLAWFVCLFVNSLMDC